MIQEAIEQGIPVYFEGQAIDSGLNHLYGYTGQNPLNNVDPFGLDWATAAADAAAGISPYSPAKKRNRDCQATCQIKYQLVCTGSAIGMTVLTSPLGGAATGVGCMVVKALVCKSHCDDECPVE